MNLVQRSICIKNNEEIFQMVKLKYTEEIKCVEKIEKFLEANYGWSCSNDEKLYLVLHIQRLTSK
jgi:beta-glucoside operon transcriptional antiterminator